MDSRAPAINVEYVRTDFLCHFRAHRHALGLTSEYLDRVRTLFLVKMHLAFRLRIASRQPFDRNKFRHNEPNAASTLYQPPKGIVRHTRHW